VTASGAPSAHCYATAWRFVLLGLDAVGLATAWVGRRILLIYLTAAGQAHHAPLCPVMRQQGLRLFDQFAPHEREALERMEQV
jgi:hypothetical protein